MSETMLMTLGIEDFFWARPLSTPLMVAVFAAVVLLSAFLYRRAWGLPLWLRVLLGVARLVALSLVVASLFEPTAVVNESHAQARALPVLIDVSESMSMKDPRKDAKDVTDAAAALGMLDGKDPEPERVAMQLDAGQRQAETDEHRLDRTVTRQRQQPDLGPDPQADADEQHETRQAEIDPGLKSAVVHALAVEVARGLLVGISTTTEPRLAHQFVGGGLQVNPAFDESAG